MGLLDSLAQGFFNSNDDDDDDEVKKQGLSLSLPQIAGFVQGAVGIVKQVGLPKLIDMFKKAGLGEQVMSWITMGVKNKPVSGKQVESALGDGIIGDLAKKSGLEAAGASSALAKYLPKVIDMLTPDGDADEEQVKKRADGFDIGDLAKGLNLGGSGGGFDLGELAKGFARGGGSGRDSGGGFSLGDAAGILGSLFGKKK